MPKSHVAYCPACDTRVEKSWAWAAERWMDRHERVCPELALIIKRR